MTDAEIIKALKIHTGRSDTTCKECVFYGQDYCRLKIAEAALDLINRQKAELENQSENFKRLVAEHRKLQTDNSSMQSTLAKMSMGVEEAKAEAIKEFAEKVKTAICQNTTPEFGLNGNPILVWNAVNGYDDIDNLVKEMVGDNE